MYWGLPKTQSWRSKRNFGGTRNRWVYDERGENNNTYVIKWTNPIPSSFILEVQNYVIVYINESLIILISYKRHNKLENKNIFI